IRQGGPERRCEPQEVEEVEAGERRSNQDPQAIAVVERVQRVGGRANPRLISVYDRRNDEENDELQAARAPQEFPECTGVVRACGRCGPVRDRGLVGYLLAGLCNNSLVHDVLLLMSSESRLLLLSSFGSFVCAVIVLFFSAAARRRRINGQLSCP